MKELFSLLLFASCGVCAATPEIENLQVTQDSKTHVVAVSFSLSEKAVVTLDVLTNGVTVGVDKYSSFYDTANPKGGFPAGRVVAAGSHLWQWRPSRSMATI